MGVQVYPPVIATQAIPSITPADFFDWVSRILLAGAGDINYSPTSATTYNIGTFLKANTLTVGSLATLQAPNVPEVCIIACKQLNLAGVILAGNRGGGGASVEGSGAGGGGGGGLIVIAESITGTGRLTASGDAGGNASVGTTATVIAGKPGSPWRILDWAPTGGGYGGPTTYAGGAGGLSMSAVEPLLRALLPLFVNQISRTYLYSGAGGSGAHGYNAPAGAGGGGASPLASGGAGGYYSGSSGYVQGGGGGGAGGIVVVITKTAVPSIQITAPGGRGGDGYSYGGGGGGGAGGVVVQFAPSTNAVVSVPGGSGGAPASTGTAGSAGSPGVSIWIPWS